jgi:uncharacterized protein YacL
MNIQLDDVGHTIQLAIAPVFLLSTVCTKLIVLTNRMSRVIDRSRILEERLDAAYKENYLNELRNLDRRYRLISIAISLSTGCGLFVCSIIALLFLGNTLDAILDKYIAGMFVTAIVCFVGSFSFLLSEIFIASRFRRKQYVLRRDFALTESGVLPEGD